MSTECAVGLMPFPESAMVRVAAVLLESIKLPLAAPAALGEKTTLRFVLWPALRLMGVVRPVLKAEPVIVSWVMVMGAVPVLVTFTDWPELPLTTRLPKLTLLGVAERLALVGVGLGLGLGTGVGVGVAFAARCPTPPQPAAIIEISVKTTRRA